MRALLLALAALAAAGPARAAQPAVRIVFGGDVMLGRGVADLAARQPDAVQMKTRFIRRAAIRREGQRVNRVAFLRA